MDNSSRKYNEEFNRFRDKQPPTSNSSSRYMEYRKRENLLKDKMEHPEKYITPEPKVDIAPEPSPMVFEPPKKSWFSKLFGKD